MSESLIAQDLEICRILLSWSLKDKFHFTFLSSCLCCTSLMDHILIQSLRTRQIKNQALPSHSCLLNSVFFLLMSAFIKWFFLQNQPDDNHFKLLPVFCSQSTTELKCWKDILQLHMLNKHICTDTHTHTHTHKHREHLLKMHICGHQD
jgi:hypothetical protein